MALIDMLQHLKSLEPDEFIKDAPDGSPVSLRSVCTMALNGGDQRDVTEKDKLERFFLAQKISLVGKVELTADEIVLLKRLVGAFPHYGPLIVGRVFEILDPASMPKAEEPPKKKPLKAVKNHEAAQ